MAQRPSIFVSGHRPYFVRPHRRPKSSTEPWRPGDVCKVGQLRCAHPGCRASIGGRDEARGRGLSLSIQTDADELGQFRRGVRFGEKIEVGAGLEMFLEQLETIATRENDF